MVYLLAQVAPDPRGHGTHEQLGMAACSWPTAFQAPCPTCGATTAATHLVHLSPVKAVVTQPFGAALAAAGIGLAVWAAFCLAAGRSFMAPLIRAPYGTVAVWTIVLFFASWGYKYLVFTP